MLQLIGPTNCHLPEGLHRLPGSVGVCIYYRGVFVYTPSVLLPVSFQPGCFCLRQ